MNYDADRYGSHHREELKRSMERPAGEKYINLNRRKGNFKRLLFEIRRWWRHCHDDFKLAVWAASVFLLGVAFWAAWLIYPR